ncbi:MAG: hypothetical protein OXU45_07310 [Candidatus Melainabacteria bacterium]|nr:hypothetical protein [Candidatus Melainabacteria bacterium]
MASEKEKLSQSDKFELELDEFFKDRAEHRANQFSDKSKKASAKERSEKDKAISMDDKGSGCCMTGCHDCPWAYNSAL